MELYKDYTYEENVESSAYTVHFNFPNHNLTKCIKNDDFTIGVYDKMTGQQLDIDKDNIGYYGMTSAIYDEEDIETKNIESSLVNNNGILVYINSEHDLMIKQLIYCSKPKSKQYIGYNNCTLNIWLDTDSNFTHNTQLMPKLIRDEKILQVVSADPDPVLKKPNMRQEFDYTACSAFNENAGQAELSAPTYDYPTDYTSAIFVNTEHTVPCYYSTVTAYTRPTILDEIKLTDIYSSIYDYSTRTNFPLTYTSAGPFVSAYKLKNGCSAELEYYTFKQYLSADDQKLHQNKLYFSLNAIKKFEEE